jgi:hypothetical protein
MPEPVILHVCPGCGRVFDSPSVCLVDNAETVPTPMVVASQTFEKLRERPTIVTAASDPAPSPLAELMAIPGEREAVEARAARLVAEARAQGASWAQVGAALRISKQAAHERYGGGPV